MVIGGRYRAPSSVPVCPVASLPLNLNPNTIMSQSAFTPIPANLPPLPAYDATTHWWAYRGTNWKCDHDADYAYFESDSMKDWSHVEVPRETKGFSGHYIELVPINHEDPAYRAYVEDAFKKGAKIEIRYLSRDDSPWQNCGNPIFDSWASHGYRIAPSKPAPEKAAVDYDSREHKLAVPAAALDREKVQFLNEGWQDDEGLAGIATAIGMNYKVRIKPAPPAPIYDTMPLDDIRVSELLEFNGFHYVVTSISGPGILATCVANGVEHGPFVAGRLIKGRIHRNGQWQPCSKQVARKHPHNQPSK